MVCSTVPARKSLRAVMTGRTWIWCCWSLWIGVSLGCGKSEGVSRSDLPSRTSVKSDKIGASETDSSAAAEAATSTAAQSPETTTADGGGSLPLLERSSAGPSAGDPLAEGWEGEAFSEQALKQLQAMGAALEVTLDRDATAAAWMPFLSSEFQSEPLLPASLKTVLKNRQWQVERAGDPAKEGRPLATSVAESLAPLCDRFRGMEQRKTKFKLFRVELHEGRPRTRQYFHLAGHSSSEAVECNATWVIDWDTAGKGILPKVRAIRVEQPEVVTAKWQGGPWLADATRSLLREEPKLIQLLQRGIDYWEARLDRSCGVFNFGYQGIAIGDVNGDLLDDVYVCETGGLPNHLLVQQPDGTVRDAASLARVDYLDNTRSALLIDLDNDGDADLVLAMVTGLVFLENDGHGVFAERAKIASVREGMSLAAADYDGNGFVDLYVCVYYGQNDEAVNLPLPLPYFDATNGGKNHLISNRGSWQFEEATQATGLDEGNNRFSFAATWEDDDRDGDLDLLVVNDFGPNQLYRYDGGRFRNVAQEAGLVDGAFGMSATRADFDHDGDQDIYVSNMFSAAGNRVTFDPRFKPNESAETRAKFQHLARGNSLFRNRGDGTYEDVSVPMQVTMGRWSWGSLFVDINNDSWDDLLVANGFITGRQEDDL